MALFSICVVSNKTFFKKDNTLMNVKESLKHLRKIGYHVDQIEEGWMIERSQYWVLTDRELVKMAKAYSSENNHNTAIKKPLKHFRHRNNRSRTRQDLHAERFDNFSRNKLRRDENPWNWD